jgi:hypothetical protein
MKVKKRSWLLLVILIAGLTLIGYYNTNGYIKKHSWKHSRKSTIGDWLEFDTLYKLKGRKIIKNKTVVGSLVFCFNKYLVVYSREQEGFGYYYLKK